MFTVWIIDMMILHSGVSGESCVYDVVQLLTNKDYFHVNYYRSNTNYLNIQQDPFSATVSLIVDYPAAPVSGREGSSQLLPLWCLCLLEGVTWQSDRYYKMAGVHFNVAQPRSPHWRLAGQKQLVLKDPPINYFQPSGVNTSPHSRTHRTIWMSVLL